MQFVFSPLAAVTVIIVLPGLRAVTSPEELTPATDGFVLLKEIASVLFIG